ncbi:MAG: dephospho-CoA kinase [Micavibrio aeruginosavorus]|uniref:Dephospho-CoA kinase n=1 Tax=Micavibrio aeruginosavorus TaxID=349221 RepID=A0A7T5UHX4_9BACT|nr:MAG: dephospho-CoA kinase [Micavibrio aeruginosavorus]
MIVLGLTGSIGMGKSTATAMLRGMGIPVHCSDEAVHQLLDPCGEAIRVVAAAFPESYDKRRQAINRAALGRLAFSQPEKRVRLESILHPLVVQSQRRFLARNAQCRRPLVVLDIPLLFETGAERRVDYTLVVTAPAFIQRMRVLTRPGMTPEKFAGILASQMPDHEKRRRADFVIDTGLGLAHTRKALRVVLDRVRLHEQTGEG